MSKSLTMDYPDAFNLSLEKIKEQKSLHPKYTKNRKKEKKLLKRLKELHAQYLAQLEEIAEAKRLAEEARIAEEERKVKKEPSFWAKLGDVLLKALPNALNTPLKFCVKNYFSSKKKRKKSKG